MIGNCLSRSVLSLVVVAILAQRSSSSEDPCSTTNQMGNSKRTIDEDPGVCGGALCDNNIVSNLWYRLDAYDSGARMPESCVPVWHCGTYIPIWLNGAHPTDTSPGPTSARVCAQLSYNGDCCEWNETISVKRCYLTFEYFVYQLKRPPYCDMAYCAGSGPDCKGGSWNDILNNCTTPEFPSLGTTVVLSDPYITSSAVVNDNNGRPFTATSFSLKCTLSYTQRQTDDGARYGVVFRASDGSILYSTVLKSTDKTEVVLGESYLVGHLDQNIICSASAYWLSTYPKRGPSKDSNSVYIGFSYYRGTPGVLITGPFSVNEGDRVTISVVPSFPITTPACLASPTAPCYPSYTFRVYASQLYLSSCSISVSNGSISSFIFSPIANMESTWRSGSFNLISDNTLQTRGSILSGYNSKVYEISIIEQRWKLCQSNSDPHVTSFFGNSFNFFDAGQFTLISIPSRKIEVQVTQVKCWNPIASCNCAVIAREGNNILGIDNCQPRTSPTFIRYLTDANNPGGYIRSNVGQTTVFTIVLPSGMIITAEVWFPGYLTVNVYMYGLDSLTNIGGICSHSSTNNWITCTDQCSQYRVGGTDFHAITDGVPQPPCISDAILVPQCQCTVSGSTTGSACPTPSGDISLIGYSNTCTQQPRNRRKRQNVPNQSTTTQAPNPQPPTLVWPTPNKHIEEQQAIDACNNALKTSTVYDLCINRLQVNASTLIQACIMDIQIIEDFVVPTSFVSSGMEVLCKASIDSTNSTTKDQLQQQYVNQICPKQCSGQGQCVNGACQCRQGYQSSDCSIKSDTVPTLISLASNECNIRDNKTNGCTTVYVSAANVSSNSKCKITNSVTEKTHAFTSIDDKPEVNLGSVVCHLPSLPISLDLSRDWTICSYSIDISLSNDGTRYSNSLTLRVYDSSNTTGAKCGANRNFETVILPFFIFILHELTQ